MPESSVDFYTTLLGLGKARATNNYDEMPPASEDASQTTVEQPRYNGRFNDITEIRGDDNRCQEVFVTGSSAKKEDFNDKKFSDYSLLLRHIEYTDPSRAPRAQMEIQSDILREEFRKIAGRFTYLPLNCSPIVIAAPYCELYHCHKEILDAHRAASGAVREDLDLLLEFYERFVSLTLRDIKSMIKAREITFQNLWALFPPGEIIVLQKSLSSAQSVRTCVAVERYEVRGEGSNAHGKLTVIYRSLECPTEQRVIETHLIHYFTGVTRITDLPAFPLKHHPHSSSLRENFIERGQRYTKIYRKSLNAASGNAGSHLEHDGPIWIPDEEDSDDDCDYFTNPTEHIRGRFIVDPERMAEELPAFESTFRTLHTANQQPTSEAPVRSTGPVSQHSVPPQISPNNISVAEYLSQFTEEDFMTFPARVKGYSISRKKWGYVLIDHLKEIIWENSAFDKLQANNEHKQLIKTLVSSHREQSATFDDVIREKGLGLIFLLCGPPGCGKTMTAETVAESLHCPLYIVTSEQLGSEVSHIEYELKRIFKLVVRWKAVLLIDEADVYMAKRTDANSQVFLRLLEYQGGIVFLSTNRHDNIDSAFESRVHVQILYKNPGPEERVLIWQQLTDRLKHSLTLDDFHTLAERELSGRDIKNALQVASLYSLQSKRVQRSDIELALKYIVNTQIAVKQEHSER